MIAPALHSLDRTRLGAIASVLVLLVSISLPMEAQALRPAVSHACLDTISADVFVRVPVYLEAKASDTSARALLPAADTLAIRVAAMIRTSLTESTKSLPEGEMLLQWRQVGSAVRIVAHRDGHFTWTSPRDGEDSLHGPSRLLLVRALTALRDGGTKVHWPAGTVGDSVSFDLTYRWPDVGVDGTMRPILVRDAALPMFSMAMPRGKEVAVRRPPRISYPLKSQDAFIEGVVILEFIVDSTGRVKMNTIRDTWPANRPRLIGEKAEFYQAFLDAAKWSLSSARYEPATLGGCPVPQLVQLPITFSLER